MKLARNGNPVNGVLAPVQRMKRRRDLNDDVADVAEPLGAGCRLGHLADHRRGPVRVRRRLRLVGQVGDAEDKRESRNLWQPCAATGCAIRGRSRD